MKKRTSRTSGGGRQPNRPAKGTSSGRGKKAATSRSSSSRRPKSSDDRRAPRRASSGATAASRSKPPARPKRVIQKIQHVIDDVSRPDASTASLPRLQKVLASAGFGSRRECETLIEEGRVQIDREFVTQLGTRVDPEKQLIQVDGESIPQPKRYHYAVNKPSGIVSTSRDPDGRMRVIDLVGGQHRLFTVGRLDKSSEGLIIVTNDGELAHQLTHPSFGVEKTYRVQVAGHPTPETLEQLKEGFHFSDGFAKVKYVRFKKRFKQSSELEIVLDEGRNREVRRLLARIGHKVNRLKRIAIGPLGLGELPTGEVRRLSVEEVEILKKAIRGELPTRPDRRPPKRKPRTSSAPQQNTVVSPPANGKERSRFASRFSWNPARWLTAADQRSEENRHHENQPRRGKLSFGFQLSLSNKFSLVIDFPLRQFKAPLERQFDCKQQKSNQRDKVRGTHEYHKLRQTDWKLKTLWKRAIDRQFKADWQLKSYQ